MNDLKTSDTSSSFSPEEYIALLYRSLLGREPDDAGLIAHASALRRHGDPTEIMKTFLESEEYQNRSINLYLSQNENFVGSSSLSSTDDALSFILKASERHFSDPAFLKTLAKRQDLFSSRTRPVKKIALYYWRMNNGGTERVTARQAIMWSKMGYEIILITDQEERELEDYEYGNIKRYTIPERMMHNNNYTKRGRALSDILHIEDVDLFITNQWYEISTIWDVLVAKSLGIPTIVGWHNVFDAGIHGVDDLGLAYLRQLGYHHANLIAVLSSVDQIWFENWQSTARLVHNPLTFDTLPHEIATLNGHTILWLARTERHQKRIDHVLRMFPLVLAEVPEARLFIVGGGPDLEWAREYAHALGVGSRVHFTGYTTEVDKYIEQAAVHVMTSEFEGYPMVLSEVWSHGVPTVMYDLPHLEYLRSGRGHLAVEQKNIEQLAAAVVKLLQNIPLRRNLGAEARTVVEEIVATNLDKAWQDIFNKIGKGEKPSAPAMTRENELESMRILVKMLGDKMLSLYGPNNAEEPSPYLPSQAPTELPKKKGARQLLKAARFTAAPYFFTKKLLTKQRVPSDALRMIDLSHVGLGDNLMIWAGLYTLLENGVPLCAPGCVIHVQPILADLCSRMFSRFGLIVQRGKPEKQISPVYSPLPPSTLKEWWHTYAGHDWRMNWVEAIDLQKSFPRHGADKSFRARARLLLSERLLYRRRSWTDAVPSYIGFRVWEPIAAKNGIYPTTFLSQIKQSLNNIRRIVADYVDEVTPPEERGRYSGNAAFPAGKSFQTIPPLVYNEINESLGGNYFTCYVQDDSPWNEDFHKNGIKTHNLNDIKDTFRIIKYSDNILTTDSFTSHLAQFLRDDFTLVLSRDMRESIVHPGSNPRIVANHPACAPCNYQERYDFDRCVAGYNYCMAFENETFVRKIADCFRS